MLQDLVLVYLMMIVKAPTWCLVLVGIDMVIRILALGIRIQKATEK